MWLLVKIATYVNYSPEQVTLGWMISTMTTFPSPHGPRTNFRYMLSRNMSIFPVALYTLNVKGVLPALSNYWCNMGIRWSNGVCITQSLILLAVAIHKYKSYINSLPNQNSNGMYSIPFNKKRQVTNTHIYYVIYIFLFMCTHAHLHIFV